MTEQDTLREQIKWAREFWQPKLLGETGRNWVAEICDAAQQSLTFRRLPLPEELDDKALFAMRDAAEGTFSFTKCDYMRRAYQALYDHLTKPTYTWRVRSGSIVFVYDTEEAALAQVVEQIRNGNSAVISRTGEPT